MSTVWAVRYCPRCAARVEVRDPGGLARCPDCGGWCRTSGDGLRMDPVPWWRVLFRSHA